MSARLYSRSQLCRSFLPMGSRSSGIPTCHLTAHGRFYVHAKPNISIRPLFTSSFWRNGDQNKAPQRNEEHRSVLHENIYTIPNFLTVSRIVACPVLGWAIVHDNFEFATALLVYAGLTDTVDGFIARRFKMTSVLGTILDPAADKALMTTLTVTLAMKQMIPAPLAVVILGRDVLLSLSAFYIRYTSLPPPKTFGRYWDMSIPSAEVHPTKISKVNTLLQLMLMASTTIAPVLPIDLSPALHAFQWVVATTTIWSGASYLFSKDTVRVVVGKRKTPPSS